MADVTTQITGAAAIGVSSATVGAMLGVEPQALFWAFVGAAAGLGAVESAGRWRALVLFVPAVLGGALTGTAAAAQWFSSGISARNFLAMGAGAVFHVVVAWALANVGRLLDSALRRNGAGQ